MGGHDGSRSETHVSDGEIEGDGLTRIHVTVGGAQSFGHELRRVGGVDGDRFFTEIGGNQCEILIAGIRVSRHAIGVDVGSQDLDRHFPGDPGWKEHGFGVVDPV